MVTERARERERERAREIATKRESATLKGRQREGEIVEESWRERVCYSERESR